MAKGSDKEYGYHARVALPYEAAVQKIREVLKEQGFGILTEIDVTATLKAKLDVDFGNRYIILGACNPQLAYRALQAEPALGLLLPCNVIVHEDGEDCVVAAVDPHKMLSVVNNPSLASVADEAGRRLRAAIDAMVKENGVARG